MKFIAVFLILNILLLSSFSGIASVQHGTASCCKQKAHKDGCKQQKQNADNDCAKESCNAMLSCGTCGFIVNQPLAVLPAVIYLPWRSAHPFVIDALSDYHANGWNPPKA